MVEITPHGKISLEIQNYGEKRRELTAYNRKFVGYKLKSKSYYHATAVS